MLLKSGLIFAGLLAIFHVSHALPRPDELIFGLSGWNGDARTVRKLVHNSNWTTLATVSTNSEISGFPMLNLVAVADSPMGEDSTGNIYFYLSSTSFATQNIQQLNNVTAIFAEDDELDCVNQDMTSLQSSCPYAVISGTVVQLYIGSQQYTNAQNAVLNRHPVSANYIQNNNFYLCQLNVENVYLYKSNGIHNVSVTDYYNDKIFGIFDSN